MPRRWIGRGARRPGERGGPVSWAVVWVEARRGASIRLSVVVVLLLAGALAEAVVWGPATWSTTPMTFLGDAVPFVQAVVVAVATWEGGREQRRRVSELLSSTPRPVWQRVVSAWVPVAGWPVLIFVVAAIGFVVLTVRAVSGPALIGPVAATAASVVAGAALGFVLGRHVPGRFTAPAAGVVVAAAWAIVGSADVIPAGLLTAVPQIRLGSAWLTPWSRASMWDRPVWWFAPAAGVWFLAVSATLLTASAARRRWWAVAPAVVAAAAATMLMVGAPVWRIDTASPQLACSPGAVQVCVPRGGHIPLGPVAASSQGVRARLATVPDVPRSYLWPLLSCATGTDHLYCTTREVDPHRAGAGLAGQVTTWKCLNQTPAPDLRAGAQAWLLSRTGQGAPAAARRLAALSTVEQQAWISRYLHAADECDTAQIPGLRRQL